MRHLCLISKAPFLAQDVAPEVKLTFIRNVINVGISNDLLQDTVFRDLIDVMVPVFTNKDPQNPIPPETV